MLLKNFQKYQKIINKEIAKDIALMGAKSPLRDACEYILMSRGKRFRPILVMMIQKAIGKSYPVISAALCVEYYHTASLIADDLPCMDDEKKRRDKPTLHKVFNEATAILASYTLIARAYEMIEKNAKALKKYNVDNIEDILCLALQIVSKCAGLQGATYGQFLDLFPSDTSLTTIERIIHQKTVTLFEVAFCLGWLFGGGDIQKIAKVQQCSHFFGKAFQIADDLEDFVEDKKKKKIINLACKLGKKKAKDIFDQNLQGCKTLLKELHLFSEEFQEALLILEKKSASSL